jgi:purine-nucleoside phosphorylase
MSGTARPASAAEEVRRRLLPEGKTPGLGVVLGSGWDLLPPAAGAGASLPVADLPGLVGTGVPGHEGSLELRPLEHGSALLLRGRIHLYEGHGLDAVLQGVDLLAALGVPRLLLTCAVGTVADHLDPGDLVLVRDHLNLIGADPARERPRPGVFPDRSEVYDAELRGRVAALARDRRVPLRHGVLAALAGPGYETPAEIRALAALGADMVCMSTVPEALAARDGGMRVVALAAVANRGAGKGPPLRHGDVLDSVARLVARRSSFLDALLDALARP